MTPTYLERYLAANPPNFRREGQGTITDPISRLNGLCAVENCDEMGVMRRESRGGVSVYYCAFHEIVAHNLFGDRDERTAA